MGRDSKETERDSLTHLLPQRLPQPTFAGLAVGDGLAEVAVEALLAVVAVPARRVVPAVEADAAALAPRQLVQLHVEAAAPRVQVAVAGWERQRGDIVTVCAHPGRCQPRGAAAKPSVCALSDRGGHGMRGPGGTSGCGKPAARPRSFLACAGR